MKINIANNDSNIIDIQTITAKIVIAMNKYKTVTVTTNNEGPCAHELGLYALLDNLCNLMSFPKKNVTIETCNLLEKHSEYNIVLIPQMYYLNSAKEYSKTTNYQKVFDDNFKHFGSFIGHGNRYRLQLGSSLYTSYRSQTLQTYHCDIEDSYHRDHIGIEDLMFAGEFNIAQIRLLLDSPLTIDKIESYPILNPATLNITKVYPNFFVELISLTYFSGNTFYIDEKIWRPMIMRTPFMIQGPKNYILNLQKLGFKTFSAYWDEAYSQDPCNCQVTPMLSNIQILAKMTISELESMYKDMQAILEYNYNHLMNITSWELLDAFR